MKRGKPMRCRWCGKGIRRLADGTHTHRIRNVTTTSDPINLGPVTLPSRTTHITHPETPDCWTRKHGAKTAAPTGGRVVPS